MNTKRYLDEEWDPIPIMIFNKTIPDDVFPVRLEPEWFKPWLDKKKPDPKIRSAGSQIIPLSKWEENIQSNFMKFDANNRPNTIKFWSDFCNDITMFRTPDIMLPDDVNGPSQWERLITFCRSRPEDFVHPCFDDMPELDTRDLEPYDVPYGGAYVKRRQARCTAKTENYVPAVNDIVFINIQAQDNEDEVYNMHGVPEPGKVVKVDFANKLIEVDY